jgi:sulfite exporter TauE/SafE/copper chaperone CopZ
MHCINCAGAVERLLRAVPHVQRVRVHYPSGRAAITHADPVDVAALQSALAPDGYTLSPGVVEAASQHQNTLNDYAEIGAVVVVLGAITLALQHLRLLPHGLSVSDEMGYGLVFIIGLVASVSSCLAITGGLLVALAAKYNEATPNLSDRARLVPHLCFNLGRIVSYTLLGGAIGGLGAALSLSPGATGTLTLIASAIMVLLGLSMLGLLPTIGHFLPRLPCALSDRLHHAASNRTRSAAFLLGGATFFLPCGFTQALQLYVLSQGSFVTGALTMLAFALGTLPALLSLSTISSLARGALQRHFLRFAGAAVILLGILNIQYGLVLTGGDMSGARAGEQPPAKAVAAEGATAPQRISMKVVGLEYQPHQLTVKQGIPVQWWIDASQADGCGRFLLAPRLGIRKLLSGSSTTLITFTPDQPGEYAFNCGMGMMTPDSKIIVTPNGKG